METRRIFNISRLCIYRVDATPNESASTDKALAALLPASCQLWQTNSMSTALAELQDKPYDAALMDLSLSNGQGMDNIDLLLEHFPDMPLVVLSNDAEESELAAARLGMADHIVHSDASPSQIIEKLYSAIEHNTYERATIESAFRDRLTGLTSAKLFFDHLAYAVERVNRSKTRLALLLIDLDNFRQFNQRYGRQEGDQLLARWAAHIRACVRRHDLVARLGGDEFAILLEDVKDQRNIKPLARKILTAFNSPAMESRQLLSCSAGIGAAFYSGDGNVPPHALIAQAHSALRHAKKAGINQYKVYFNSSQEQHQPDGNIAPWLDRALERNEFFLLFQAQLDSKTHRLFGAEALLRWRNNELGEISPDTFMPPLEASGKIHEVGKWVLRGACQLWSDWHGAKDLEEATTLSLKLSATQLMQEDIVKTVSNILQRTGLKTSQLDLGLSEAALDGQYERKLQTLKKLRELGINLTITDFGATFTSLPYLRQECFNRLKLDANLVTHLLNSKVDAALAASIVQLAKQLELTVIAEGVDSWEKVERLTSYGCRIMQGFYYNRPLPANTFIERYRERASR